MGCNCGGKGKKTTTQATGIPTKSLPQRPPRTAPVSGSTMGPTRGQVQSFTLTLSGGRTQSFGSELEARAALARAGGRGSIA